MLSLLMFMNIDLSTACMIKKRILKSLTANGGRKTHLGGQLARLNIAYTIKHVFLKHKMPL